MLLVSKQRQLGHENFAMAYPSMHALANGTTKDPKLHSSAVPAMYSLGCVCVQYVPMVTLKERAELLRRWVQSGENLSACEHNVRASRTANFRGKRVRKIGSGQGHGQAPSVLQCDPGQHANSGFE